MKKQPGQKYIQSLGNTSVVDTGNVLLMRNCISFHSLNDFFLPRIPPSPYLISTQILPVNTVPMRSHRVLAPQRLKATADASPQQRTFGRSWAPLQTLPMMGVALQHWRWRRFGRHHVRIFETVVGLVAARLGSSAAAAETAECDFRLGKAAVV